MFAPFFFALVIWGCWQQQEQPTGGTIDTETDSQTDTGSESDTASDSDSESDTDTGTGYLPENAGKLVAIWGSSSTDIWAGGYDGTLLHGDGTNWELTVAPSPMCIHDIHGRSWDDVYTTSGTVYGSAGYAIMRFNGDAWANATDEGSTTCFSTAVWENSSDDVYAILNDTSLFVGLSPLLLHFDGSDWTSAHFEALAGYYDGYFYSMTGAPGGNLFVVGDEKTAKFDGTAWQYHSLPLNCFLLDVWAHADNDAFAVGQNGVILHHSGLGWSHMTSPVTVSLHGIYGLSSDSVFAVGLDKILHYDGAAWSEMIIPTVENLQLMDVWGSSSTDVYAVGGFGAEGEFGYQAAMILHYDGVEWSVSDELNSE